MTHKKEDRRVKMTKFLLRQSLIDLLEEKSIVKITIKEICEKADVNRTTFYAHFSDQYMLLESIEEEYIEKILNDINQDMMDTKKAFPVVTEILKFIYKNEKMSRILLSDRGDLHFQKKIMKLVHDNVLNQMKDIQPINYEKAALVSSFVISGCIGIIQKWFENDLKSTPEEIGKIISDLTSSALIFIY
jgi:AcrR family transcriptional regulator